MVGPWPNLTKALATRGWGVISRMVGGGYARMVRIGSEDGKDWFRGWYGTGCEDGSSNGGLNGRRFAGVWHRSK
jgi:hypothetical protein